MNPLMTGLPYPTLCIDLLHDFMSCLDYAIEYLTMYDYEYCIMKKILGS